ncbi:DUF503 domain-containing protein [Peptoniphilus indolicus]|uniref:Protein of uncharacterized function (DUF503) n=1 Tax=Peptoniphilus indolicus TaxID=33030 RepID=A0A379DFI8_9FIRM|nr:DUF503 domain-containing protein [Peptoniphilus indolicus]SUB76322.1 Protein of uncharacterised function (DUF503) [Peptoniphilus indolicus]
MKLRIFSTNSLKEKRRILKSLIQKMQSKFKNISIAEVGDNDLWQSAVIGIAVVSNDSKHADKIINKCVDYIDVFGDVEIVEMDIEMY